MLACVVNKHNGANGFISNSSCSLDQSLFRVVNSALTGAEGHSRIYEHNRRLNVGEYGNESFSIDAWLDDLVLYLGELEGFT